MTIIWIYWFDMCVCDLRCALILFDRLTFFHSLLFCVSLHAVFCSYFISMKFALAIFISRALLLLEFKWKDPQKKRRETHTDTNQPQNRSSDSSMRHNCRIVDTLCRWKSGQICVLQFMCIGLVRAMEKNIGLRHCSRFFVCSFFRSACVRYHGLCV